MHIRVIGSNFGVGQALTDYVSENLEKSVKKYFDKAVNADVYFAKQGYLFEVTMVINEGVAGGIVVKSDASAGDVYGCFNEALEKAAKQLRRYKRRIKSYRRDERGIRSVLDNALNDELTNAAKKATKYVLTPLDLDLIDAGSEDLIDEQLEVDSQPVSVINEKITDVEELSVTDAIMKMDLANLPALVFINKDNRRINVVYYRKDGNISWIDPN